MGKRVVYVGGLAESISDHELRQLFDKYGLVARAYVVKHKNTDKSAGYGFVEMTSAEQARSAVVALEGTLVAGCCLRLFVTPHAAQAS